MKTIIATSCEQSRFMLISIFFFIYRCLDESIFASGTRKTTVSRSSNGILSSLLSFSDSKVNYTHNKSNGHTTNITNDSNNKKKKNNDTNVDETPSRRSTRLQQLISNDSDDDNDNDNDHNDRNNNDYNNDNNNDYLDYSYDNDDFDDEPGSPNSEGYESTYDEHGNRKSPIKKRHRRKWTHTFNMVFQTHNNNNDNNHKINN
jgi:hypothetical protein